MIYFQIKNSDGKVISENMESFFNKEKLEKNKNFSQYKNGFGVKSVEEFFDNSMSIWFVVEGNDDLLKSSKLFKKTLDVYKKVSLDNWEYYKSQINFYSHTIDTIQTQIRQKLEGFAKDESFYGESHVDSLNNIATIISEDKEAAADLICYIHKRTGDLRAHILGADVICAGVNFEVNLKKVDLKRAVLSQITPFLNQFNENSIKIKIFFDNEDVVVDKNMFSLVMYNFFSNAVKYVKPDTDIRMSYIQEQKCLDISMISLKIERSEIKNLFNDGTRGVHAKDVPGKGIGLFVLKRALELMKKDNMFIDPHYAKGDNSYVENHFKFIF